MKLNTKHNDVEMSGFSESTKEFTIKASPKAFQILSSALYSDKPLAVIRELSCNAYDAHIVAGTQDKPFDIHLPNTFEPFFSIRDYGTGLSEESIMNLYTTYFESTKGDSNDLVGCLGLGSKSPFSYVDQFSVTSYFNGTKSVYMVFIADSGTPSITKVSSEDTEGQNGVEINMMVKPEDYSAFSSRAVKFFHRFPVAPNITGARVDLTKVQYTLEGPNYKFRSNDSYSDYSGCVAIQGVVGYPIDFNKLSIKLTEEQECLLRYVSIDILFNIGELDIVPSREALSYDKVTQANILKAIEEIQAHIPKHAQTTLAAAPNLFEAKKLYNRWLGNNSPEARFMKSMLKDKVEWRGQTIDSANLEVFMYDKKSLESHKANLPNNLDSLLESHKIEQYGSMVLLDRQDLRKVKPTPSHIRSTKLNAGNLETGRNIVVILNDEKLNKSFTRIIHNHYKDQDIACIAGIRPAEGMLPKIIEQFGGFTDFVMASELDELPKTTPTQRKVANVRKLLKVTDIQDNSYTFLKTEDRSYDINNGGTYIVLYNHEIVSPKDLWVESGTVPESNNSEVKNLLKTAIKLKLIDTDLDNIFAVSTSNKGLIKNNKNWVSIFDLIAKRLNEKLNDKDYVTNLVMTYELQKACAASSVITNLINHNREAQTIKLLSNNSKFLKFFNYLTEVVFKVDNFITAENLGKTYLNNFIRKYEQPNLEKLVNFTHQASVLLKTKKVVIESKKIQDKYNEFIRAYPFINQMIDKSIISAVTINELALYINMCDKAQGLIKQHIKGN